MASQNIVHELSDVLFQEQEQEQTSVHSSFQFSFQVMQNMTNFLVSMSNNHVKMKCMVHLNLSLNVRIKSSRALSLEYKNDRFLQKQTSTQHP